MNRIYQKDPPPYQPLSEADLVTGCLIISAAMWAARVMATRVMVRPGLGTPMARMLATVARFVIILLLVGCLLPMLVATAPTDGATTTKANQNPPWVTSDEQDMARLQRILEEPKQGTAALGSGSHEVSRVSVFDCGDHRTKQEVVDLTQPEPCNVAETLYAEPVNVSIQIVQEDLSTPVAAWWCYLEVHRVAYVCGFDDITYGAPVITSPPHMVQMSGYECLQASISRQVTLDGATFHIPSESPIQDHFYSRGTADHEGSCDPVSWFTKENPPRKIYGVEITHVTIRLAKVTGNRAYQSTRVGFKRPNLVGTFKDGYIFDDEFGVLTWNTTDAHCHDSVSLIYQGGAQWFRRRSNLKDLALPEDLILMEDFQEEAFAGLLLKKDTKICSTRGYKTHILGISVIVSETSDPTDLLAQLDFKAHLDPMDTALQTQLGHNQITSNLNAQKIRERTWIEICTVERKTVSNKIQSIAGSSNPYSLLDLYGPGHTIYKAGAAAYVMECAPRQAEFRDIMNCTQEIPIWLDNKAVFADPLTYVVKPFGTFLPCNSIAPVRWYMYGSWWCASPVPSNDCTPPKSFLVNSDEASLTGGDFTRGMGSGVLSKKQRAQHIAFMTLEGSREAVLNKITANSISNAQSGNLGSLSDGYSLGSTLDASVRNSLVAEIKHKVGALLIPLYSTVGKYWIVITGCFLIFSICRVCIGCSLRCMVTQKTHGCGFWMLAALWETAWSIISMPWAISRSVWSQAAHGFPVDDRINPDEQAPRYARTKGRGPQRGHGLMDCLPCCPPRPQLPMSYKRARTEVDHEVFYENPDGTLRPSRRHQEEAMMPPPPAALQSAPPLPRTTPPEDYRCTSNTTWDRRT